MTFNEIFDLWEQDAKIDLNLTISSIDIAKLHYKYLKYLTYEKLKFKELQFEINEYYIVLFEYFQGNKLSNEDLEKYGLIPEYRKILKTDVQKYIDGFPAYNKLLYKLELIKQKVDCIESILKMVMNRNFTIKNIIENQKFKNGIDY